MKTINIEKYGFGSRPDSIGDNTLFYSGKASKHAKDVNGFFVDSPPKLSPNHASLVWRYYHDTDTYLLIHVQGAHVVSKAKGRQYAFRAGYEVSRDDMNSINFQLTRLFEAMPRIATMASGRVEDTKTSIDTKDVTKAQPSKGLSHHILKAVMEGTPLYISIKEHGESYKNDGIFKSEELNVLLATIDQLPIDKRRYVGFGFCVDTNFAPVLDTIPIIIYIGGSSISIPDNACVLTWDELTNTSPAENLMDDNTLLPGESSPLLTYEQMAVFRKTLKGTSDLKDSDWQIWLGMGHQLSELNQCSWSSFWTQYNRMDSQTQQEYINCIKDSSLSWSMEELTEDFYTMMDFDAKQTFILQKKVLKDYILNGDQSQYSFLFPKGMTNELKQAIDVPFVKTLEIGNRQDAEKWYAIFESYGCLSDSVKNEFTSLFSKYTSMSLAEVTDTLQLAAAKKISDMQKQYIKEMDEETLLSLIRKDAASIPQNAEKLLSLSEKLPKEWNDYISKRLRPTIIEALKTESDDYSGPLADKTFQELNRIESFYLDLKQNSPHVFEIVKRYLKDYRESKQEPTREQASPLSDAPRKKTSGNELIWIGCGVLVITLLCDTALMVYLHLIIKFLFNFI